MANVNINIASTGGRSAAADVKAAAAALREVAKAAASNPSALAAMRAQAALLSAQARVQSAAVRQSAQAFKEQQAATRAATAELRAKNAALRASNSLQVVSRSRAVNNRTAFLEMAGAYISAAGAARLFLAAWKEADNATAAARRLEAAANLSGISLSTLALTSQDAQRRFNLLAADANDLTTSVGKLRGRAGDVKNLRNNLKSFLDLGAAQGLTANDTLTAIEQTLRGQDEGLDRLLQKNPRQVYAEWAKQAGVSAAKMTDAQKAQAVLAAVTDAASKVNGAYAQSLDTVAGKQAKLATDARRTLAELGTATEGRRIALLDWASQGLEGVSGLILQIQVLAARLSAIGPTAKLSFLELQASARDAGESVISAIGGSRSVASESTEPLRRAAREAARARQAANEEVNALINGNAGQSAIRVEDLRRDRNSVSTATTPSGDAESNSRATALANLRVSLQKDLNAAVREGLPDYDKRLAAINDEAETERAKIREMKLGAATQQELLATVDKIAAIKKASLATDRAAALEALKLEAAGGSRLLSVQTEAQVDKVRADAAKKAVGATQEELMLINAIRDAEIARIRERAAEEQRQGAGAVQGVVNQSAQSRLSLGDQRGAALDQLQSELDERARVVNDAAQRGLITEQTRQNALVAIAEDGKRRRIQIEQELGSGTVAIGARATDALVRSTLSGIEQLVAGQASAGQVLKRMAAEPLIAELKMNATKAAFKAKAAFLAGNPVAGAGNLAAAAAYTAGAAGVARLAGTGGGGGVSAGGGGGGSAGGSRANDPIAGFSNRGRGGSDGMGRGEIVVIVKNPEGRELDRQIALLDRRAARGQITRPVG